MLKEHLAPMRSPQDCPGLDLLQFEPILCLELLNMMLLGTGYSHPEQQAVIHSQLCIDQIFFFYANVPENLFL